MQYLGQTDTKFLNSFLVIENSNVADGLFFLFAKSVNPIRAIVSQWNKTDHRIGLSIG